MTQTPRRIVLATVGFFLGLSVCVLGALTLPSRGAAALGLLGGGLAVILLSSWVSVPREPRALPTDHHVQRKDPAP